MHIFYNLFQSLRIYTNKILFGYKFSIPSSTKIFFGSIIFGGKENISIGSNNLLSCRIFADQFGKITIGNYCVINERTVLRAGHEIIIGNYVMISSDCYIIDNNSHSLDYKKRRNDIILGQEGSMEERNVLFAKIVIQDDVRIGRGVYILKGVTIGKGAIIGAGSIVTKNVDPFTVVAGNPAKEIKKLEKT